MNRLWVAITVLRNTLFAELNTLTDIVTRAKTDQALKGPAKWIETICRRQGALGAPSNMACHMERMAMGSIPKALPIRICHLTLVEVLLAILQQFFFYICHLR
jgi:hypothetical protein